MKIRLTPILIPMLAVMIAAPAWAQRDDEDIYYEFDMASPAPRMGATPGGAQDIGHFRDRVTAGEVPHANTFTPEGLFSEHDLPVRTTKPCGQMLCLEGESMEARLLVQQRVRYLGQIGFSSGLDPRVWQRAPLNIVAVVDKSGSMDGQPLDLVRKSLHQLLRQMKKGDKISIVLYGDRSYVHLPPTTLKKSGAIRTAINAIASSGSTNMEEGLQVGFDLAQKSARGFEGSTRVMLFTDERPNVGRTDAQSFMGMAERASKRGIGMTTIGVSVQFGAELATKISSVRGGNLFFFPDAKEMVKTFTESLDTMVTELAYDMKMTIKPGNGVEIAGVYGIPGDMLKWKGDAIEIDIATIFLSKKKGAIYVALAHKGASTLPATALRPGQSAATVNLSYTDAQEGVRLSSQLDMALSSPNAAGIGLTRGAMLVNQVTTMKAAAEAHHRDNDQEQAYQLIHALASTYRQHNDPTLDPERKLVYKLEGTLAKLSGHQGEDAPERLDPVSGLPMR